MFSLIRFSEYGKGDAVANETEETRKKKATRRSPRGPQRGAQIEQRERSLDQRSVQGEPTLTSTRPLTVRFSRRSEPKTSARAVQYRENNSSRRDRELSEKKEREPSKAKELVLPKIQTAIFVENNNNASREPKGGQGLFAPAIRYTDALSAPPKLGTTDPSWAAGVETEPPCRHLAIGEKRRCLPCQ